MRESFLGSLFESKGRQRPDGDSDAETPYDRAAALVAGMDVDTLLAAVVVDG